MERGVPVCVCVRVRACTLSTYRGLAACPCSEVATHPKAVGGQVPGLEPCLEPAEAPARPALSVAQVGPGRGGCEGPAGTGLEEPQRVGTGLWRRRRRRRRKDALGKRLMRPPEPRGSAEDGYGELYFPHLVDLRILILGYRLGFHGFRGVRMHRQRRLSRTLRHPRDELGCLRSPEPGCGSLRRRSMPRAGRQRPVLYITVRCP